MTSLALSFHTAQAGQVKDEYAQSAPVSPTSSTSDSVFSNGDARSSQSSAPSSVKGSPLTYESLSDSDAVEPTDSVSQQFSQTSLNYDSQDSQSAACVRRHPRRTHVKTEPPTLQHESAKPVPTLVRQCDRKEQFVEALVDTATEMIEVIWPLSRAKCSLPQGGRNILDLRKFVQEVLRRSKTSHSTLQVALFYLMLLIPFVPKPDVPERALDAECRALRCGRRMFLAALILASKYLQDRNYTMSAWAKISGLKKEEICFNELAFLKIVDFDLHVPESKYKTWTELVFKCSVDDDCRMARTLNDGRCDKWRAIIPHLTADLAASSNCDELTSAASTPPATPAPSNRWTPPASPYSTVSERSDTPMSAVSATPVPPPQFLEPKVGTSADNIRFPTSPKLSKLETPCLPPISFDCTPAAGRSQRNSNLSKCPAMGLAMQQAQNLSGNRRCGEVRPCLPTRRTRTPFCRRSGLSQCSSSSGDSDYQVEYQTAAESTAAHESYLRASHSADKIGTTGSDSDAACAARILSRMNPNSASAYPTPRSMCSLSNGSSFSESDEEVSTPKVEDPRHRPIAKTAHKRARPASTEIPFGVAPFVHSPETMATEDSSEFNSMPGVVKHRGGAMVDYGAGVDDLVRSRSGHFRSASGSRGGARKKPCSSLGQMLRA